VLRLAYGLILRGLVGRGRFAGLRFVVCIKMLE